MRYLLAALGLLVLIGALAAVKFTQISSLIAMGKQMEKSGPPPETVASTTAGTQEWSDTLPAVGSIAAAKGVTISNEVPGIVKAIRFESGAVVRAGQVLVELDSSVERSQLASINARRELAQLNASRTKALVDSATIAPAQLDTDLTVLKTSRADEGALRVQIDRKTVRAPFAGRLGIRNVNLGQYLSPGTPLTVLEATDTVFVDFTLSQQLLPMITIGMPVAVTIEGAAGLSAEGAVTAVDTTLDAATRTAKIRASLPNKDEKLRPGMFASVAVKLPAAGKVVVVPASSIVHATYGDSVFIVEDKKPGSPGADKTQDGKTIKIARQQFVRLGQARGDFVAIVDGVKAGDEIVAAGAFKLRNNASIVINNDVVPKAEVAPHPTNR